MRKSLSFMLVNKLLQWATGAQFFWKLSRKLWCDFRTFHREWGDVGIYLLTPASQWLRVVLKVWTVPYFQVVSAGSAELPRVLKKAPGQRRKPAQGRKLFTFQKHLPGLNSERGWRDKVWVLTIKVGEGWKSVFSHLISPQNAFFHKLS